MIIGGSPFIIFDKKNFKRTKVAIFSMNLWCYCEIFLVLAKYKGL